MTCGKKTLLPSLKNLMYANVQCSLTSNFSVILQRLCFVFTFFSMLFVLYSDGCVVLCSILQAVEAKQMQDEMAGIAGKPLKVKGGKTKVKKAQLPEVMPSAHGIRVVPRVTAEMKADAEKRAKKKVKVKSSKCLIFYYILLIQKAVLKKYKFFLVELVLMKQSLSTFWKRNRILGYGTHCKRMFLSLKENRLTNIRRWLKGRSLGNSIYCCQMGCRGGLEMKKQIQVRLF